ncbi:alpha/beta hydrolase family protein [Mangrovitalea sediminis]|uniref:alpha/beta hydrolase family protein n=1 Tax=Mangrovitalea sediminis TaxID=1982043 RepID=UPI000BE5BF4B|nr:alpha/beta fold hydrolase [Mangrovitalea sediminis]
MPQDPQQQRVHRPFTVVTDDGISLKGRYWRQPERAVERPVVIINPATSVICRYYFRFADYLFQNGFDVVTYDYRGIGESKPSSLRGFSAGWIDWGHFDFQAVMDFVARAFPGQPIHVVAHSVGGFVLGLARSNHRIRRVMTVGAQYAYWRDYAPAHRLKMLVKWHLMMPLMSLPLGYFPGKRLGWLEDTPGGVVRDWVFSRPRFEDTWRGFSGRRYPGKQDLVRRFSQMSGSTLALSFTDDEFGTVPAIHRLLAYYHGSKRTHLRIEPNAIGERSIGHFGYFNSRFSGKLWDIALKWLRDGTVVDHSPGIVAAFDPGADVPKAV